MTNPNDAAYPLNETNFTNKWSDVGLTKREYFASAALTGLLMRGGASSPNEAAFFAIETADALIAELGKNDE